MAIGFGLVLGFLVACATPGCISDTNAGAPDHDGGSSSEADSSPTTQIDSAAPDAFPSADAAFPDETSVPDAGPAPALLRFAWFVGGVPTTLPSPPPEIAPLGASDDGGGPAPAYDVCIAPHGSGLWTGPLLAAASLAAGLHPFDVTSYFPVVAGRYDARIVPAGSTTCDLPDAGAPTLDGGGGGDAGDGAVSDAGTVPSTDFTSLPSIASGSAMTAVLVDPLNPGLSIADLFTFTDDTSTTAGMAKVRFVNVSEDDLTQANPVDAGVGLDAGTVTVGADFGLGGGVLMDTLFTNVTSSEQLDPTATHGYREVAPLSGIDSTLLPVSAASAVVGETVSNPPLATASITLPAGGLFTAFYASEQGDGRQPVLVWCYDGQTSATSASLTQCAHTDVTSDSQGSFTRFGNFSADDVGRDVCVKYHSYGSYVGPLLATDGIDGGTGIPSQFLSAYFNLHGGFAFDARFVNAGATDCDTSVAPDTTYTAYSERGGGGYTSVLLTGYASVPADAGSVPPFDAGPPPTFGDDAGAAIDAGSQPVSVGLTTLATSVVVIEDESYAAPNVAAIRLVHLAAMDPAPLTMQVNANGVTVVGDDDRVASPRSRAQATTTWVLADAPYGGFSTRPGPTDPFGYLTMATGSVDITIDSLEWSYALTPYQTTMFAFDAAGGLELLACIDYDEDAFPQERLYGDCCVVGVTCASAEPGKSPPPVESRLERRAFASSSHAPRR
jgi:hypothetical protein